MTRRDHRFCFLVPVAALVALISAACGSAGSAAQTVPTTRAPAAGATTTVSATMAIAAPTHVWFDQKADDRWVTVQSGRRIAVYDARTNAPRGNDADALLSASRTVTVHATVDSGHTTVTARNTADGTTRATVVLDGELELAALSTYGESVALTDRLHMDPVTGYVTGRSTSHIVVVLLATQKVTATIDLPGNYVPEAFLGTWGLGLIEYNGGDPPTSYRVRSFDLASRSVGDVVTHDKTKAVSDMRGYGRSFVLPSDGFARFTLYHAVGPGGHSFVHELLADTPTAFCIDLPEEGFGAATALAISPDNRTLYVAGANGAVAMLDARLDFSSPAIDILGALTVKGVVGVPSAIAVSDSSIYLLVADRLVIANRTTGTVERTVVLNKGDIGVGVGASGQPVVITNGTTLRTV